MRSIKNPIRTLFSLSFGAAALCLCIHCGHGGGDSNPGNGITGHAYVLNGDDTISIYTLGATGALKPMTTLTVTGTGAVAIHSLSSSDSRGSERFRPSQMRDSSGTATT